MTIDNKYASNFWANVAKSPGAITPGQVESVVGEPAIKENSQIVKQLLEGIDDLGKSVLVEIGCGEGRLMARIAPLVKKYIGLDVTDLVIGRAKDFASTKGIENVEFHNIGNTTNLVEVLKEKVDVVVSFNVFMHMPPEQVKNYFKEAQSILRPGGRFHFDCAATEGLWEEPSCRYDNVPEGDLFMARWFPKNMIADFIKDADLYLVEQPQLPHMVWKTSAK